jgi:DNA polymerase-4
VAGRTVAVKLRYPDFTTLSRRHTIPRATCLAETIYEEARHLFLGTWDRRPIRLLGVGVSGVVSLADQTWLFADPEGEDRRRRLADTIDRLQERYGSRKLVRAPVLRFQESERPSHVRDRQRPKDS